MRFLALRNCVSVLSIGTQFRNFLKTKFSRKAFLGKPTIRRKVQCLCGFGGKMHSLKIFLKTSVFRVFRQFEVLTFNLISGGYYNAKEEPENQMRKAKAGDMLVAMLTQLINNAAISICLVGTPETELFFEQTTYLARRAIGLHYETMP